MPLLKPLIEKALHAVKWSEEEAHELAQFDPDALRTALEEAKKRLEALENEKLSKEERLQKELDGLKSVHAALESEHAALRRKQRIEELSRSGKTFLLCCMLVIRALRSPGSRHAIIRRYGNAVRSSIGADTLPKVLKSRFQGKVNFRYRKSEGVFLFPNQAEIWLTGLDDVFRAEKILGKEFATIYFNECSELDYPAVLTAMTRLAQNSPPLRNRALFDCNPPGKSHWTYRLFLQKIDPAGRRKLPDPENYAAMCLNPADNAENLPPGYIDKTLASLPARQRARFLEGKFLEETGNALWTPEMIDRSRVVSAPGLRRIVIGVDPAVTAGKQSDSTGIVAAALGENGEYYVLEDRSMHAPALQWCKEVVSLYHSCEADRVVGEVNNGGDLIEALLRKAEPSLSFRAVRASRGKILRAEPAAALYEKDLVHHVGVFPLLEEQMCSYDPAFSSGSPDRMDALVWALEELSRGQSRFILA